MRRTRVLIAALVAFIASAVFAVQGLRAQDKPASDIPADTEIVTTKSGLKYSVLKAGKEGGKHPKTGDIITVHYTGWTTDGRKFDSSRTRGTPAKFTVGQLVPGWNEALALMTVGAHWKLTIPPELGYGERGSPPTIPPKATLIFEMELIDFVSMPDFVKPDPAKQKTTASGLKYEVVTEGKGEAPKPEDVAEMKLAFWTADGMLLECTESRGSNIKARREDLPLPFFKEALDLLQPGARLRFEVPPALAFGDKAQGPIAPNSTTIWEIELVSVIKPLPLPAFVLPADDKLTKTASGLKYEVIEEGSGTPPHRGQKVTVHYAGWLTDGTSFDSSFSRGETAEFPLGAVIRGWNEGMQLMKPGAIYRFVIPPELAYGPRPPTPKIPPNSTLVFWVKLVKVGE